MQSSRLIAAVMMLAFAAGCVPTLYPLYTEADLIYEPALVGSWSEKDSTESWVFSRDGDKRYRLVYTDGEGRKGQFVAHLLKLESRMYLDLYPVDPELLQNDFYKMHLLSLHSFLRVRAITPTLQMAAMDPEWLKERLEKTPDALRHEKSDRGILVTAPTKELQGFLKKHETTAGAWGDFTSLVRNAEAPPAKVSR